MECKVGRFELGIRRVCTFLRAACGSAEWRARVWRAVVWIAAGNRGPAWGERRRLTRACSVARRTTQRLPEPLASRMLSVNSMPAVRSGLQPRIVRGSGPYENEAIT